MAVVASDGDVLEVGRAKPFDRTCSRQRVNLGGWRLVGASSPPYARNFAVGAGGRSGRLPSAGERRAPLLRIAGLLCRYNGCY